MSYKETILLAGIFFLCTAVGWLLNNIELGMGIGFIICLSLGYSVFDEN